MELQERRRQTKKILIVDDEPAITDLVGLILSVEGYECCAANSGEEALRRMEQWQPDLVISDVMMPPGMNGVELAKRITDYYPGCAVLLFSGNAATQDLLRIANDEGLSFPILAKPAPPRELVKTVAQVLSGAAGEAVA